MVPTRSRGGRASPRVHRRRRRPDCDCRPGGRAVVWRGVPGRTVAPWPEPSRKAAMPRTFLHAADIHLDSPLRGLERYENAPANRIRNASRRAFTRLVDLAIGREVDFVLIAGDLYDGNWPDYNTGLFLTKELARL